MDMDKQSNIIGLVPKAPDTSRRSEALIDWLEDRLEEAKAGELQGMAGACQFSDECQYFVMGWAGSFAMTGALQTAILSQTNAIQGYE